MTLPKYQTSFCSSIKVNFHLNYYVKENTLFITAIFLEKSDVDLIPIVSEEFWEECMDFCLEEYNSNILINHE